MKIQFANNENEIKQYKQVRDKVYASHDALKGFLNYDDGLDSVSQIIVMLDNGRCIGGARYTLSTPNNRQTLPMETEGFNIIENITDLDLSNKNYIEISRFAILPEYRDSNNADMLFRFIYEQCLKDNVDYIFNEGAYPQAVRNRRSVTRINVGKELIIRRDISIPMREVFNGVPRVFMQVNIN